MSNSQRSAARLSWRAGCALVLSPFKKARGMERWTALARLTDAPGGPPRGRADLRKIRPEITGHTGPARLPALHRGVFLAASGRAFSSALSAAVSQLLAGGHSAPGRSP